MPTFDYSAYNPSGKLVRGIISAESEKLARKTLKDKKLLASSIKQVKAGSSSKKSLFERQSNFDNFDVFMLLLSKFGHFTKCFNNSKKCDQFVN